MANYLDNKAGSSQTVCEWLVKYNALCDELQTDITAIQTVNTAQQTVIDAQQAQIDDLITNSSGGNFVPLAGAQVEEGFYLSVEDARVQISGNGVELIMPSQGYVKLGPDGFTTDDTTKAGYLNDTTLRSYSAMDDKEWVAKGQLQKVLFGVDVQNGVILPYHRHLFYNVENFDFAFPNITIPQPSQGGLYIDGDRLTLVLPYLANGITLYSLHRIVTDIRGATSSQNVNTGQWVFYNAPAPANTHYSKYELVYSSIVGFLIDVKHYI